jgi:hypothetical protein
VGGGKVGGGDGSVVDDATVGVEDGDGVRSTQREKHRRETDPRPNSPSGHEVQRTHRRPRFPLAIVVVMAGVRTRLQ